MHRKSSYSKHGNYYKGRWKHPLMKSRLRLNKLLSFRPSMNTVLALVFEAISGAPNSARASETKSTETRNSFKHAADDESVYTAAKYSKMPQCFACIRGVWGFIDKKSRQYICAKQDTVSTDQTPAMKPKPNAFTALEHPIPNLGITSL